MRIYVCILCVLILLLLYLFLPESVLPNGLPVRKEYRDFLRADVVYQGDISDTNTVTIPLGGGMFFDVDVPSASRLVSSDYNNYWEFDNLLLSKLSVNPVSNNPTVKIRDDLWITTDPVPPDSEELWFVPAINSFNTNTPYLAPLDWTLKSREVSLPVIPSPTLPLHTEQTDSVMSALYTLAVGEDNPPEVLTVTKVYSSFEDAVADTAARVSEVLHKDWDTYYENNGSFVIAGTDFLAGVRYINLNTQFTYFCVGENLVPYALHRVLTD